MEKPRGERQGSTFMSLALYLGAQDRLAEKQTIGWGRMCLVDGRDHRGSGSLEEGGVLAG